MTNEILLWKAMIDQAITDSLRKPLNEADLRPLPEGEDRGSSKYQTASRFRWLARSNEHHRISAQHDLAGDSIAGLYAICYKEKITGLLKELKNAWADIEQHPDKSNYYVKIFKSRRGER